MVLERCGGAQKKVENKDNRGEDGLEEAVIQKVGRQVEAGNKRVKQVKINGKFASTMCVREVARASDDDADEIKGEEWPRELERPVTVSHCLR